MLNDCFGSSNRLIPQNNDNIIAQIVPLPQARPLSPTGIMAAFSGRRMMQDTITEAMRGHCQALLTKAALDDIAALSSLESHLTLVAPSGQERYRVLIDAFAVSSAMRIAGR